MSVPVVMNADPLAEIRNKLMTPLPTAPQNPAWRVDPTYDNTLRSIQQGIAGLSSNVNLQEDRARTDLQKNQQSLLKSRDDTLQQVREALANRGIGRSSIHTEEQGNVQTKYQEGKTGLETGFTRSMEDLARETLGKYQGYNDQLAQAQVERAGRQADFEKQQAMEEAQAKADKDQADNIRSQLESMKADLLKQLTPQPTPTGQMKLPPPPPPPKPPAPPKPLMPPPPPAVSPEMNNKESIKEMQFYLNAAGFPLTEDGYWGPKTKAAVIAFQQKVGMPVNGILDENLARELMNYYAGTKLPVGLGGTIHMRSGQQP